MKLSDLHSRIADLQSRIDMLRRNNLDPRDALNAAMEELSTALEELDIAQEEFCHQDECLQFAYQSIEAEHRRYLELFNLAPDGYLVTDLKGIIQEANVAAVELLGPRVLGRQFADFLGFEHLDAFKATLSQLKDGAVICNWEVQVLPRGAAAVVVSVSANATHDVLGRPDGLRWQLHDITQLKDAKEALQESEEKYRQLIENANEAIVVAQDGMIKFINPKFLEITGRSREDLLSRPFAEFIHPDDRRMVVESHLRRLRGEAAPERYDFRIVNNSGETKWVEVNPVKIFWMGRPATLNFLSDITKRKKAEERLRLFQSVVSNASEGVVVMVPSPSNKSLPEIDYVNKAFEKMTGYGKEELIGRHPVILDGPSTDPSYARKIVEGFSNKEPVWIEKVNYRRDGTWFWSELNVFPLLGEADELDYFVSIERDVTQRHSYEEELKASKEKYRELVENINDVICSTDSKGVITYISPAVERMMGYLPEEMVGRHFGEFLLGADVANYEHLLQSLTSGEPPGQVDLRIVARSGDLRHIRHSARPVLKGSEITGLSAVITDITDRKQAEEDLRRSNEKYHKIFENSILGLYQSVPDGRFLSVNLAFSRLFGYNSPVEMITSVADIGHQLYANHEDRGRVISQIVERGFLEGFELEAQKRDGTRFWISMNVRLVQDEDGTHFDGTVEDITKRKRAEDALEESEGRYRAIFENTGTAMAIIEDDTTISCANAEFERLAGYKKGEIAGKKSWTEFVIEEDLERMLEQHRLRRNDQDDAEKSYEFRFRDKWGKVRDAALTMTMMPGSKQSIASILEITDQKKNHERLSKLNDCFLSFGSEPEKNIGLLIALCGEQLGATYAMYNCLDGDKLRPVGAWNSPPGFICPLDFKGCFCYNLIRGGRERIEVIRDLQSTDYAKANPNVVRYGLRTYIGRAVSLGEDRIGSLCVVYKDDCILCEEDEKLLSIVTSAIGVEEKRRLAEEALRKSEEKYRHLVQSANSIILRMSTSGKITFVNEFAQKFFGCSEGELIGTDGFSIMVPEMESTGKGFVELIGGQGSGPGGSDGSSSVVCQGRRKNGERVWIAWTNKSILDDEGSLTEMLCVGNDVTERKLAEEKLAASLQEKEVMLKEIHHRVKNNLQIIASLLNIQAHYARDEGAAEVLSECHNRVRSMALVHESLYSSENLAKVNFARYVSRLAESLFSSFGVDNQKIKLDLDLDDVLLSIDRAIPCGLIVNELVSNCLKHAFPGDRNGTIEIKLKRLGADDVLLNVKDDGVGVPQGLDPQKTQTLGLKLVSDLTRQIKGTFRFTSSAGTDMAITFPV